MKKIFYLLFPLFIIMILSSCVPSITDDYAGLSNNHVIEKITPEKLDTKIKNGDSFVVVLGFPSCPWCQALVPVADEVAKEENYKKLYYVDIKDMRDNDDSKDKSYYLNLVPLCKRASAYDDEKDRINAPTTLSFKDGNVVGYNIDTVSGHVMDETSTLPPLSNSQKQELKDIIKGLFDLSK